jgi:hypothetical protein
MAGVVVFSRVRQLLIDPSKAPRRGYSKRFSWPILFLFSAIAIPIGITTNQNSLTIDSAITAVTLLCNCGRRVKDEERYKRNNECAPDAGKTSLIRKGHGETALPSLILDCA